MAASRPCRSAVGDDHVLVDRDGQVMRVNAAGERLWTTSIQTLSGIARAPVAMPGRPGQLLFITETGAAWVLDPANGELEGPWELKSPPVLGPATVGDEVHVVLHSGELARWKTSLRPSLEEIGNIPPLTPEMRFGEVRARADPAPSWPTDGHHRGPEWPLVRGVEGPDAPGLP